jgi:hypothetical protein
VLKDIWEGEKAALLGDNVAHILNRRTVLLATKYLWKPVVVVLIIVNTIRRRFGLLTEGKTVFG